MAYQRQTKKKNKNNTIAAAVWVEIKIETVF